MFPVHTHVHRVSGRLGLIAPKLSFDKAHDALEAIVPADIFYPFHINLINHGRAVCKAVRPLSAVWKLADLCDDYQVARAQVQNG